MFPWVRGESSVCFRLIKPIKSWIKPKGQIQPHMDLPINMPTTRNEAIANHGKITPRYCHPLNKNCMAVKASPAVFWFKPHVHSTGSRSGNVPRLKIIALKNMKERNWTIRRGVLYLSNFCIILLFNFSPLSCD